APAAAAALDAFWQGVAGGSVRLGETAAGALGRVIAPLRAGMLPLPDLPLREVVDGVARGVVEALGAAADAAGPRLAPAWEGALPPPQDAEPREPPPPEQQDLAPPLPDDPSRRGPREDAPGDETARAAALLVALFSFGPLLPVVRTRAVRGCRWARSG